MPFFLFLISLIIAISCLALVIVILNLFFLFFIRIPSISTDKKHFKKIFGRVSVKGKVVYDLGSGGGDLVLASIKAGARKAIGFEISPWPFCVSVLKSLFQENAVFRFQNFSKADLKEADIVYVYLTKPFLKSLALKLEKEFKGIAISLGSPFPWKEKEKIVLDEKRGYAAFVYQL